MNLVEAIDRELHVWVELPRIDGDTVTFTWTQSGPNPFQERNAFTFRYESVDLSVFSSELLVEIFLGLQLGVWRLHKSPITVELPCALPARSVVFWQAYHGAEHVSVHPAVDHGTSSPWANKPVMSDHRTAAVFFGGGKDSLLTTCLLSELYGRDEVLAIQFVIPRRANPSAAARVERRQEELMLGPLRHHLGVATQRVWTDYLANTRIGNYLGRPHAELYTLAGLPILLSRGVSLSTFCLSWTEYGFFINGSGQRQFLNARSRPEVLQAQTRHYQQTLGIDLTVTNLNLLFTGLSATRMLTERYPDGFARIVSCVTENPAERWCYRCRKCSWYPMFGLHCGAIDPTFDYDRLFRTSPHLLRMVEYGLRGIELSDTGNAPVDPALQEDHVFPMFCHLAAGVDPTLIADRLSADAYGNLLMIKALFGHRSYPGFEMIPAQAVELLNLDIARSITAIAASHLSIADELLPPLIGDAPEMTYDFSVRMPTAFPSE